MKENRFFTLLLVFATLILMTNCKKQVSEKGWYDYGNGVINLSSVSHIESNMSFTLILSEKDEYGENKKVELVKDLPITKANVQKIREGIINYSGAWESVSFLSAIQFDGFTLRLYNFETAGLPCTDQGCIQLAELWLSEYNKLLAYIDPYRPTNEG